MSYNLILSCAPFIFDFKHFLGNCEAGKSTLISVLTHNELDNGSGRARLNLLRHIHEIQTGHTSSISNEIMGFNNNNEVSN